MIQSLKSCRRTLPYVLNHPLCKTNRFAALFRFLKWQTGIRLVGGTALMPFTSKTKLLIEKGMEGATGNIYCGLHEFDEMAFLLHTMRRDDVFIDVGANVGTYSVLAAGHVGAGVLAYEPVPTTYQHLSNNIRVNRIENLITAKNVCVGDDEGVVSFATDFGPTNHVITPTEGDIAHIDIDVVTLDGEYSPSDKSVYLKVDVEGFEKSVIDGAETVLANRNTVAVVMELNGSGGRYGFDDTQTHKKMIRLGYKPYKYEPFARHVKELTHHNQANGNTIYIKDFEKVANRLIDAPTIELPWRCF